MSDFPKPGRYRHYKHGNEYTLVDIVFHSETEESMVLYRAEYGERRLWVRPAGMFSEYVTFEGERVQRFQYVGDEG